MDFLGFDDRIADDNLHLDLGGYEWQAVLWHVLEVTSHLGGGYFNVLHDFLTHLANDVLIADCGCDLFSDLSHTLSEILLHFLF